MTRTEISSANKLHEKTAQEAHAAATNIAWMVHSHFK
jgi:hypothetical protein